MFQIFITSINTKTITLNVNQLDTIKEVKETIFLKTGIPCIYHILVYNGKNLLDTKTIESYKIKESDTIRFSIRIGNSFIVTKNNKNTLL
jgi:hypothetical protein